MAKIWTTDSLNQNVTVVSQAPVQQEDGSWVITETFSIPVTDVAVQAHLTNLASEIDYLQNGTGPTVTAIQSEVSNFSGGAAAP